MCKNIRFAPSLSIGTDCANYALITESELFQIFHMQNYQLHLKHVSYFVLQLNTVTAVRK